VSTDSPSRRIYIYIRKTRRIHLTDGRSYSESLRRIVFRHYPFGLANSYRSNFRITPRIARPFHSNKNKNKKHRRKRRDVNFVKTTSNYRVPRLRIIAKTKKNPRRLDRLQFVVARADDNVIYNTKFDRDVSNERFTAVDNGNVIIFTPPPPPVNNARRSNEIIIPNVPGQMLGDKRMIVEYV